MAWGVDHLERDGAQREALAISGLVQREPGAGLGRGAVNDSGACELGEVEVAGDEVGVEVRLDHVAQGGPSAAK